MGAVSHGVSDGFFVRFAKRSVATGPFKARARAMRHERHRLRPRVNIVACWPSSIARSRLMPKLVHLFLACLAFCFAAESQLYFQRTDTEYTYTCPSCSGQCTLAESLTGKNVVCPLCSVEFFATPPEIELPKAQPITFQRQFVQPTRIPFFKSGKKKLLEQKLWQLNHASGYIDDAAEQEWKQTAVALGLDEEEAPKLLTELFMTAMEPIKRRMESSFVMTDDDVADIERLKKRFNVRLTWKGTAGLFRTIYLIESKHQLPTPITVGLMLDAKEVCYYSIDTTWHQSRVRNRSYSGTSISVPTGITGVRFRFGGYTPNKVEEMTPLSRGTLYVTSKRLLFAGDARSTTTNIPKIVNGHMYSDCVKIEKSTGRPDLFSMNAAEARCVLSLIGALK
jgi:hypothetical protein